MKQGYFYPLYKPFDRQLFKKLQKAVKEKYKFTGNTKEKTFFIKCLFYYQLIRDYRAPLIIINKNLKKSTSLTKINQETKKVDFTLDLSWVNFKHEKEMVKYAQEFSKAKIKIIGTDPEFDEFVLRYLVSIWLADWQGPLFAMLQATKDKTVNLKTLNKLLELWDFTNIFIAEDIKRAEEEIARGEYVTLEEMKKELKK